MVYALPLPLGFNNYNIVHLEILNLVVALKLWGSHWKDKTVEIKCDSMVVVEVLGSGKARDSTLAMCARNTWLLSGMFNVELLVNHIPGSHNTVADLLSRWQGTTTNYQKLQTITPEHIWIPTHIDLTILNEHINYVDIFPEVGGQLAQLASTVVQRLTSGFRPATMNQYTRMFKEFLFFLKKSHITPFQVTTVIILAFMEYLHQKGLSQANISNHLAGIRAMFIVYGLNTAPFKDERVPLFIKSLKINQPLSLKGQKIISIHMLEQIVAIAQTLQHPLWGPRWQSGNTLASHLCGGVRSPSWP